MNLRTCSSDLKRNYLPSNGAPLDNHQCVTQKSAGCQIVVNQIPVVRVHRVGHVSQCAILLSLNDLMVIVSVVCPV